MIITDEELLALLNSEETDERLFHPVTIYALDGVAYRTAKAVELPEFATLRRTRPDACWQWEGLFAAGAIALFDPDSHVGADYLPQLTAQAEGVYRLTDDWLAGVNGRYLAWQEWLAQTQVLLLEDHPFQGAHIQQEIKGLGVPCQWVQDGHAYRLGGDEFAVVLTRADGALETRIHELVNLLHFEFVTRECSFDLACRLGVAKAQQQDAGRLLDQAILALNQAKRSQEGDICWFEPAMLQQLQLSQHQLHQLRGWLAGREPAPLRVALQGMTDGQGNDLWQMTLYWREQGAPCPMRWLQECGVLGPVLARLLQAHEAQHGDGRALLLPLDNQAQLAHVVAYLPDASRTPRVLLVPALQLDAALLAGLRQQGCTLALRDIGSATPAQLAAGWPVRYWLPDDTEHSELLQPLARRLGLVQLQVLAGSEARQLA
ncbi:diguanylate cyclase domain-containing protein [Aeromonas hydrophila]